MVHRNEVQRIERLESERTESHERFRRDMVEAQRAPTPSKPEEARPRDAVSQGSTVQVATFDVDGTMERLRMALGQAKATLPSERPRLCRFVLPDLERLEAHTTNLSARERHELDEIAVELRACSR